MDLPLPSSERASTAGPRFRSAKPGTANENGIQQCVPPYGTQGAPRVNTDVGPKGDNMLNEKQIAKLRKEVNSEKLRRWIFAFFIMFGIVYALFKVQLINRLCTITGQTWSQVFSLFLSDVMPDEIYMGTEIMAVTYLSEALLIFGVFVIVGAFAFINVRKVTERNRLLLQFLDIENNKKAQQAGPGYPPQGVGSPDP